MSPAVGEAERELLSGAGDRSRRARRDHHRAVEHHPEGRPTTLIESSCSGIYIDDENGTLPRLATLVEAQKISAIEADLFERRSVEVQRHVVSGYTPDVG